MNNFYMRVEVEFCSIILLTLRTLESNPSNVSVLNMNTHQSLFLKFIAAEVTVPIVRWLQHSMDFFMLREKSSVLEHFRTNRTNEFLLHFFLLPMIFLLYVNVNFPKVSQR